VVAAAGGGGERDPGGGGRRGADAKGQRGGAVGVAVGVAVGAVADLAGGGDALDEGVEVLADGALGTPLAGKLMMGFGLLTVVVAAFMTLRQTDVKRLFGYSSVKHMGLITFAFGMGGAAATFAGLLHMTVHSLTKSAIFFAVGHATQKAGTQVIDEIRLVEDEQDFLFTRAEFSEHLGGGGVKLERLGGVGINDVNEEVGLVRLFERGAKSGNERRRQVSDETHSI
jgi:hypothetical protein